jgi:hypothetical protein
MVQHQRRRERSGRLMWKNFIVYKYENIETDLSMGQASRLLCATYTHPKNSPEQPRHNTTHDGVYHVSDSKKDYSDCHFCQSSCCSCFEYSCNGGLHTLPFNRLWSDCYTMLRQESSCGWASVSACS